MKVLSILVTLQGLGYCIQSILCFYNEIELKFGVHLINSNYNLVGIILGVWLIFTGIGIWYKKRYAFNSTMIVYSLLIIYGVVSIGFLLFTQPIKSGIIAPIVLVTIISGLFLGIIRYVKSKELEFK